MYMTDEEVINLIAKIPGIAEYGKLEFYDFVNRINRDGSLNLNEEQVSAIQRKGFAITEQLYNVNGFLRPYITLNKRWRYLTKSQNYEEFIKKEEEFKNMKDEDVINLIASIDSLAQFGKYEFISLVNEINEQSLLNLTEDQITVLHREGFVEAEIHNIGNVATKAYVIFNDRWRELKRFPNYEAFINWEEEEIKNDNEKKNNERKLIKAQFDLAENQKAINNNSIKTNKTMITILTVTAFIYVFQLTATIVGLWLTKPSDEKQHQLQKDSTINTLQTRNYQLQNEYYSHSKIIDSLKNLIPPNPPIPKQKK